MESTGKSTQFELTKAINLWENDLHLTGNFTDEDILELSEHLSIEIKNLISNNLSEKEAFMIATQRLGSKDELAPEFSKVNQDFFVKKDTILVILGMLVFFFLEKFSVIFSEGIAYAMIKYHGFSMMQEWGNRFAHYFLVATHYVLFFSLIILGIYLVQNTDKWIKLFFEQLNRNARIIGLVLAVLFFITAFGSGYLSARFDFAMQGLYQQLSADKNDYYSDIQFSKTCFWFGISIVVLCFILLIFSQYKQSQRINFIETLTSLHWSLLILIVWIVGLIFQLSFETQSETFLALCIVLSSVISSWIVAKNENYSFAAKLLITQNFYAFICLFAIFAEDTSKEFGFFIFGITSITSFIALKWFARSQKSIEKPPLIKSY